MFFIQQKGLLEVFYEIFRLPVPIATQDFTEALQSVGEENILIVSSTKVLKMRLQRSLTVSRFTFHALTDFFLCNFTCFFKHYIVFVLCPDWLLLILG